MCLGVNQFVLTKQTTVGPIDPSLSHPLGPINDSHLTMYSLPPFVFLPAFHRLDGFDALVQESDVFPQFRSSGEGLAFRRVEARQSCGQHDETHDGHGVGRSPRDFEAIVGGECPKCLDGVYCDVSCGGVIRPLSCQVGQVPDPERCHCVEGEALAQVVGLVEAAVFYPGSLLQGVEEPLDPPAARPFDKTQWAQPLELFEGSAPTPIAHAAE